MIRNNVEIEHNKPAEKQGNARCDQMSGFPT